jgi:hypothetical protein
MKKNVVEETLSAFEDIISLEINKAIYRRVIPALRLQQQRIPCFNK